MAGQGSSPSEVVDAIVRTHFAVRRAFSAVLVEQAVSMPQARVLSVFTRAGGPVRMSELARRIGMSNRTITPIVDALDAAGLLRRRPDPADRRAVLVEPTERGRSHIDAIGRVQVDASRRVASPLTSEEREQLVRLLGRILDNLEPDHCC